MERGEKRALANNIPPNLNEKLDTLKGLLVIEKTRLEMAVQIEKDRKIVFPETTVIIHDIMKLQTEIENREKPKKQNTQHDGLDDFDIGDFG